MQQITTLQYNDQFAVGFTNDAWFNATAVAKNYNKLPNEWLRLESTKEYIMALHAALFPEIQLRDYPVIKQNQLVRTKTGSQENGGGAWFHPKLAVAFARWLDVKFAVWCDLQTEKMLFPKPYALKELPPSMLTTEMKNHVQEMVNALKHQTGKAHNTIYHDLKTEFKASSYKEIPIVKYAAVCAYFGKKPIHEMPDLIQCDSRYLAELEQKAVALPVQQIQTVTIPMSEYVAFKNDFKMTSSDWIYMFEQQGGRIISKEQVEKINSLVGMFEA